MTAPFIIDAHMHLGPPGLFFTPECSAVAALARMDQLGISHAVCLCDHAALYRPGPADLRGLREVHEQTGGRLHYLGLFDPRCGEACLAACGRALSWPGFCGIKIHPSFHGVPADDPAYEPVWRFVAEHDLVLTAHSWSASSYNPSQALSTPERFEKHIQKFPGVRFVLGHAGGRGTGRAEALRLVQQYPNVYVDFAGDIFCRELIEDLVAAVSADRVMFGSDFPWFDMTAFVTRVLLADISTEDKVKIFHDTAARVYRIPPLQHEGREADT